MEMQCRKQCGRAGMLLLSAAVWLLPAAGGTARSAEEVRSRPNELVVWVSPAGNDAWSGRLSKPNAARTDGPVASITRARDAIREWKKKAGGALNRPVAVVLRGGTYRVDRPIVFTPEDSGTEQWPIEYRAWPGERPVLSGGVPVTGWRPDKGEHSRKYCAGRLWSAPAPRGPDGKVIRFNQFYVDGGRRVRARIPDKGAFLRTDGPLSKNNPHGFYFREGDLKKWPDFRRALFVVYHSWETSLHHVRTLDEETCRVTFWERAPWPFGRWERKQRYYVENVLAGLDSPGEWYLDRKKGVVYYYPRSGEDMTRVAATAPVIGATLIEFRGEPEKGRFVEYVRFVGIAFRHSNAELTHIRNPGQGEIYQPALIMARGLRHAAFVDCEISQTGAHGIWFAEGCAYDLLQRCHIHDLGGGGVYIGGGWGVREKPAAGNIVVDNNFIHDGGYLFHGAHGVWIGRSSYNRITHNEISNFDYTGVSCGWSWGFQPSSANHNRIEYNHIHHLGNGDGLSDMGGIYTLGISPGTTERFNHIHDVYNYAYVSHGSGIYPDEGSSEILIEYNVVHHVRTCPFFQHYGRDNIVRNNIFAFGGRGQLQRCREDKRCHFIAEGNIVYADIREMLGGVWRNGDWKIGRNVYWSTAGPPTFKGMDFETWKKKGHDEGSIVADPLFVDAAGGDFRLRPGSPALRLGFRPIDMSRIGLYGDEAWRDLPRHWPDRPLNEVPPPPKEHVFVWYDFEDEEPGDEPREGKIVTGSNQAVVVTSETAASGEHSLEFIDAPGERFDWMPHIYFNPEYSTGTLLLSWDMCNSLQAPASFYIEVRQWDVTPYRVGPTVSVDPDGTISAGGRKIGRIPLGQWVHVEIRFEVGPRAPKTYPVTIRVPGRKPITATVPFRHAAFRKVTWLGISSTSDARTFFYIDNLKLGTPEELRNPPEHHPRRRLRRPSKPVRKDGLVGWWRFDEAGGGMAEDASGCLNHGDVWAQWAVGDFGSAIFTDEQHPYVAVPDSPTLRFEKSDFSVTLWLCPTRLAIASPDARRRFLDKNRFPKTWWNMNVTSRGFVTVEMTDAAGGRCGARTKANIAEGRWSHVAMVVDRTAARIRFYLDGVLDSEHPIPRNFAAALNVRDADLTIGSRWHPFIGLLDEVRIYKRALTGDEVGAIHAKEKARRRSAAYRLVEPDFD